MSVPSHHLLRRFGPSLALLLGLATVPATAATGVGSAGPGAAGIGDDYFPRDGNGGYDVRHYDVHDTYRLASGRLSGWTDVTAVATQDLDRFDLDLVLTPTAVSVDGQPVAWSRVGRHELVVSPPGPLRAGTRFTVRVRYHGRPGRAAVGGESPWLADGREAMATNEPHIAPWWFPANDHPRDKATFDVHIRVPAGNQAISNGRQAEAVRTDDRWSTWHWRIDRPIAPYLAFFAAGRFRMETGTRFGLPYTIAVSERFGKPLVAANLRLLRRSPAIVHWLAGRFGRYPYDSTGGVMTSLYTGFALENAGRPTYPYLGSGRAAVTVLVHELAHQWFGDAVSVHRWRDIWLNEGFASWVEWYYAEAHGGRSAQSRLLAAYRGHPADSTFWKLRLADPGAGHVFDDAVYQRGGMALQALRHRLGNAVFLRLLRTWVRQHSGGTATVAQFRRLAERVSGRELDGFFRAWLQHRGKPARTVANGLR